MKMLYASCAVLFALLSPVAASAAAKVCAYDDLMPAYIDFLDRTKADTPQQRAGAFVNDFASAHPEFYGADLFKGDQVRGNALRFFDPAQRISPPGFPALTDDMVIAMGRAIGPQFEREQKRFVRAFKDFNCGTRVGFGPSFFEFDGHTDVFGGVNHLLFGVDTIAMFHVPSDMPAFFDHELFHVYHAQIMGPEVWALDTAWWNMWTEGLATYVSQRMNPGLAAQQVLWYPSDMVARIEPVKAHAAALFLRDVDKSDSDGARWFSAGKPAQDVPPRAGYYLGYLFAKKMGDGHPLPMLARMKPQQVRAAEIAFLDDLVHGR